MNEKDIRDRIGQFLKKTARTVVVPASMGLGLSSGGCNGAGLKHPGDGGSDLAQQSADAAKTEPDLAADAIKNDVPMMMIPYIVALLPDAALDTADADRDAVPDVGADVSYLLPPYLAPPPPPYVVPPPYPTPPREADELPAPVSSPDKK